MENYSNALTSYDIKTRNYQGRKHLIVPVIMMVEGVHSGSHGPILHSADEFGKFTASWDGIPIMIGHPQINNQFVSANVPEVMEQAVGRVFNTHLENNKLKAEAWLDEEKLKRISPEALRYIRNHRALDVSIGVFSDEDPVTGDWNGENYAAIARNHRPDHLALLPGEQGACSWSDGCGIRANSDSVNSSNQNVTNDGMITYEKVKELKELSQEGIQVFIADYQQGYQEMISKIRSKVDSMDNERKIHFVEEVYDDFFVYRMTMREMGSTSLYKQAYTVKPDESVEFIGDPVQVRREVNYVQVNSFKRTKQINNNKKEGEIKMENLTACFLGKVEKISTNSKYPFNSEEGKKFLLNLPESALDNLLTMAEPVIKEVEKIVEKEVPAVLTAQQQADLAFGENARKEKRNQQIQKIQANAKEVWSEEDLNAMSDEMLEKVAKSSNSEQVDYSLNGGSPIVQSNGSKIQPMYPAGVEVKK